MTELTKPDIPSMGKKDRKGKITHDTHLKRPILRSHWLLLDLQSIDVGSVVTHDVVTLYMTIMEVSSNSTLRHFVT